MCLVFAGTRGSTREHAHRVEDTCVFKIRDAGQHVPVPANLGVALQHNDVVARVAVDVGDDHTSTNMRALSMKMRVFGFDRARKHVHRVKDTRCFWKHDAGQHVQVPSNHGFALQHVDVVARVAVDVDDDYTSTNMRALSMKMRVFGFYRHSRIDSRSCNSRDFLETRCWAACSSTIEPRRRTASPYVVAQVAVDFGDDYTTTK